MQRMQVLAQPDLLQKIDRIVRDPNVVKSILYEILQLSFQICESTLG